MKLQFDFQDETIKFKTFWKEPLKVVNFIDGVEVEHDYNSCIHSHIAAKVFKGLLRKEMYIDVINGKFDSINQDLIQMRDKLDDVRHEIEKAVKLCKALAIEKEKESFIIENQ
jgi:hypothetical protein